MCAFWSNYRKVLAFNGIKKPFDRWYVIRLQNYIDAHNRIKLVTHTTKQLMLGLAR
jgi:hypothetical protein